MGNKSMENKAKADKLLERMEVCSSLPYRFNEEKIRELIVKILNLNDIAQPRDIVVCEDIFDSKFQWIINLMSDKFSAREIFRPEVNVKIMASELAYPFAGAVDKDFCSFLAEVALGENVNQKYIDTMELLLQAKEHGLGYLAIDPITSILYIAPNPVVRIENNNFHSDQFPAIEFATKSFYYLDGVEFSKELWEKVVSKNMSFSQIMKIDLADQRTVALKYNPQAIIKENAKLLDKDKRGNELYLVEGQEINKLTGFSKMYFLKMICPTGRVFVEGVDPKFAEKHPTATQCQAELCGLTLSEYSALKLES